MTSLLELQLHEPVSILLEPVEYRCPRPVLITSGAGERVLPVSGPGEELPMSMTPAGVGVRARLGALSVNVKIVSVLVLALLIAVAVGVLGLQALSATNAATQRMYTSNVSGVSAIGQVRTALFMTRMDAAMHLISQDREHTAKFRGAIDTDLQLFASSMADYRASGPSAAATLVDGVEAGFATYTKILTTKM